MPEDYLCSICVEPRPSVLYICSKCHNSLEPMLSRILKVYGMKRLLESIIDKLGDANYEIKLKEDIARALLNYNERYQDESEG